MKRLGRRWDIVHKFEDALKRKALPGLTHKESLDIFADLYDFTRKHHAERWYCAFDQTKIDAIGRLNAMLAKAAR